MTDRDAPSVAALLLAAGASRRLGAPKQLLRDAQGHTVLVQTIRAAIAAGCAPVVVVLGAHAADVQRLLSTEVPNEDVSVVLNAEWETGMATSLRCGLDAIATSTVTAALLLACDQPAVSTEHLRALIAAYGASGGRVVSHYGQVAGVPVLWPRDDWAAMRALTGDRGARALLRGDERGVALPGGALDLDTPADVARWLHPQAAAPTD